MADPVYTLVNYADNVIDNRELAMWQFWPDSTWLGTGFGLLPTYQHTDIIIEPVLSFSHEVVTPIFESSADPRLTVKRILTMDEFVLNESKLKDVLD